MPELRRNARGPGKLGDRSGAFSDESAGVPGQLNGAWFAPTVGRMLGSLSPAEIEDVLGTEVVARLGCHAEGRTYVVPVTYAYDGDAVFVQSADGLKVRMMLKNPLVCVQVDHIDNLANWRSVIAWGRFEELFGSAATAALARLRDRLQPLLVSETTPAGDTLIKGEARVRGGDGHVSIYRIHLFEKTGRFERR